MPIRFRRTFKVFPGVRLNVSKHGISTTVGPRGMHLTFNRYGVRQSLGLPGTGLSENSYLLGGVSDNRSETAEEEGQRHTRAIHHGEGIGCLVPGLGCLALLVLVAGVAIYFGADALHLHPATYISGVFTHLVHSLSLWARKAHL
jgi:uncharacterized protein DUF4236